MTWNSDRQALENKIKTLEKAITRHQKRAAALWQNQERLTQIIESIPIPAFVIDNDHIVTHYNRAMENLTGISADEIVGTRNQWRAFYKEKRPIMADFIVDRASEKRSRATTKANIGSRLSNRVPTRLRTFLLRSVKRAGGCFLRRPP
jgi:PAS domain S-box-containing protein